MAIGTKLSEYLLSTVLPQDFNWNFNLKAILAGSRVRDIEEQLSISRIHM